ncbi:MAG: squalene/phytoene synthase family protein, partial [Chthoniobacterales bacterium]
MTDLVPAPIAAGLAQSQSNSNLAFALVFLPLDRREDALTFYRFCRIVDDIADSEELSTPEKRRALHAWKRALNERPADLPTDIRDLIHHRSLDPNLLSEIVAGMEMDLETFRYDTFEDLRTYCWRAACAVGLVSARIFGATQPGSTTYAENLGLALQLTNILRDVGEDAERDRIYLPQEDLYRYNVRDEDILKRDPTPNFVRLAAFQANRAEKFFADAASTLPPEDRRAFRTAQIMAAIYHRLLVKMRADGFRVFEKRY